LHLDFTGADEVTLRRGRGKPRTAWYEAVEVRPDVLYLTITEPTAPMRADVLVADRGTGRTLTITSVIADEPSPGRPRVDQTFTPGRSPA
jgi:hypothetical protein